jgi:hypothetical protein
MMRVPVSAAPALLRCARALALGLALAAAADPRAARAAAPADSARLDGTAPGTMLAPPGAPAAPRAGPPDPGERWLRTPFGDQLLTDFDQWQSGGRRARPRLVADYNRVDPLRLGIAYQAQVPESAWPRLGARLEVAFGRDRVLYGVQLEQPLDRPRRLALGVTLVRATTHSDLQQVEDAENSLALLFGRQDYRDYFEREGFGTYLSWRVPDFSTVSLHLRRDTYRSLERHPDARSVFFQERPLRDNPAVNEGEARTLLLRLERLAHRTRRTRAGLYHWIEIEHAGNRLGGDFRYTRALADVRSVLRLSPATTLVLRGVAGHAADGMLPLQKQFTAGGVDGLRAHSFAQYRGDQMLMGQAEYLVGLWRMRAGRVGAGLHLIAFVDAGRAWSDPRHGWDLGRQAMQADGGFGLGTSEDNARIYFAKNLQEPRSEFVISARLQRPF